MIGYWLVTLPTGLSLHFDNLHDMADFLKAHDGCTVTWIGEK